MKNRERAFLSFFLGFLVGFPSFVNPSKFYKVGVFFGRKSQVKLEALEVLVPFKMEEEPYKLGETGKPLHRVGPAYVFFLLFLLMALFCSGGNAAVAGLFQI